MKISYSIISFLLVLTLSGCFLDGDSGKDGTDGMDGIDGIDGQDGLDGSDGADGIHCWDLNENGENDADEDLNQDGAWNVLDCSPTESAAQNTDVTLNHEHICAAFANLGQYPTGCPSENHAKPQGELQQILFLIDDGEGGAVSCAPPPNNGILSVQPKNGAYYWTLEGGYIAHITTVAAIDELNDDVCFNSCLADTECVASWALSASNPRVQAYTCHHFYHSDTISQWQHRCAEDISDCAARAGALEFSQRWSAICP